MGGSPLKHLSTIPIPVWKAKERASHIIKTEEDFKVKHLNEAYIDWIQAINKKESKKLLVRLGICKRKNYSYCQEDLVMSYVPFSKLSVKLQLFLTLCLFKNELDGIKRPYYETTSQRYDFSLIIVKIPRADSENINMTLTDYNLLFN